MSLTRRAVRQFQEARGADPRMPWGDSSPPPASIGANGAGIPVSQNIASGISAVYGSCSLIADSVASLPVGLRNGPNWKDSKPLPLSPLLKQPYAEISRRDWWIGFIWALSLRGNFYGQIIERDANQLPVQIKPIHNDAVHIWRDRASGQIKYRFYGREVPLKDVFHVRFQTLPGEIIGLNPIQILALTFGNAIAKERFVESFYLNSANPMGVIEVPNYLDRTETRKMMRAWIAAHQGLNKANLPAILTDGASFKPITISPLDSQLIEALNFSDAQICGRIFRVPPHMIGIPLNDRSSRGIEQVERSFFDNTLIGYLQIGMEALTNCHRPGAWVHFDTTARTRGTTLERAQAGALGMNSGFFVADEVRNWFDLAELPDGDGQQTYMPINTQLLEMALLTLDAAESGELPPSTDSGAPPRNTAAPTLASKPPRKNAPAVTPKNQNGNGRSMTREEAAYIVRESLPSDLADRILYREPRAEQRPEIHLHFNQPISVAQPAPVVDVRVEPSSAPEVHFAPQIELPAPEVHVALPEVRVEPPEVHVAAPEVHVAAPSVEITVPTPEVRVEVAAAEAPEVRVDVAAPEVTVNPHFDAPAAPDVKVDVAAPVVNVSAPDVRVEAPNVNVEPPDVHVAAPNVTVEPRFAAPKAPNVTVKPTINVPDPSPRRTSKRVERDAQGRVERVVEEED